MRTKSNGTKQPALDYGFRKSNSAVHSYCHLRREFARQERELTCRPRPRDRLCAVEWPRRTLIRKRRHDVSVVSCRSLVPFLLVRTGLFSRARATEVNARSASRQSAAICRPTFPIPPRNIGDDNANPTTTQPLLYPWKTRTTMRILRILAVAPAIVLLMSALASAQSLPFNDDFEDEIKTNATWNRSVQNSSVTNGDLLLSFNGLASATVRNTRDVGDVSLRTQLRFLDLGFTFASLNSRQTGFPAYYGGIRDDGLLAIGKSDDMGNFTVDRSLDTDLDPFTDNISLRFDVIGGDTSLTGWVAGTPEPAPNCTGRTPHTKRDRLGSASTPTH